MAVPPSAIDPAALTAFDRQLERMLVLSEAGLDGGGAEGAKFPEHALPPRLAANRVRAMRVTDAQPRVNLASFVCTAIEPECAELLEETRAINEIDADEYPSTDLMRGLVLSWLADAWHAPPLGPGEQHAGADTVGSSEGVLLAGAAAKRRWVERRKAEGKPCDKPNIVLPTDAHVVWEKLANYFEIEPRWGE
jgi:glutamate decarboxylase